MNKVLIICCVFLGFAPVAIAQNIATGPGVGYAIHSAMPMFSWHIDLEFNVKESPWSIYSSMLIGIAEGNKNFTEDPDLPYMIYSEHFENVFDNWNPYLFGDFDPMKHFSIKTAHTTQKSITLAGRYAWFRKPILTISSGLGMHGTSVLKSFIVEEHHGILHSYFNGTYEAVYLEPYYHRFGSINAYLDSTAKFRINERLALHSTIFYQHIKGFNGLVGLYAGLAIAL